jgi:hypothetical protein
MCYLVDKYAPHPHGEEPPRNKVQGEVPATVWQGEESHARLASGWTTPDTPALSV